MVTQPPPTELALALLEKSRRMQEYCASSGAVNGENSLNPNRAAAWCCRFAVSEDRAGRSLAALDAGYPEHPVPAAGFRWDPGWWTHLNRRSYSCRRQAACRGFDTIRPARYRSTERVRSCPGKRASLLPHPSKPFPGAGSRRCPGGQKGPDGSPSCRNRWGRASPGSAVTGFSGTAFLLPLSSRTGSVPEDRPPVRNTRDSRSGRTGPVPGIRRS